MDGDEDLVVALLSVLANDCNRDSDLTINADIVPLSRLMLTSWPGT
jgi:hypothetical protein